LSSFIVIPNKHARASKDSGREAFVPAVCRADPAHRGVEIKLEVLLTSLLLEVSGQLHVAAAYPARKESVVTHELRGSEGSMTVWTQQGPCQE
jgi:hypothetical protein